MIIKNIHINSFGKLKNFALDFDRGINIIYGPNEFGKSTVMDFIKLMLYSRPRILKSGKAIREKYTPWDGSAMSGIMEVECGGDVYFIQKEISSKTPSGDKTLLLNKTRGENIRLGKDEEIGERLFGIDVSCFERSSYIRNLGNVDFFVNDRSKLATKDTLKDKIFSNFSSTGEENMSKSKIIKNITDEMEKLRTPAGRSGSILKIESEILEIKKQISELDNFERLQKNAREELKNISALRSEYKNLESELKRIDDLSRAEKTEDIIKLIYEKNNIESEIKKYGLNLENFEEHLDKLGGYMGKLREADSKMENFQNLIGSDADNIPKISREEKDFFEIKLKNLKEAENRLAKFSDFSVKKFDGPETTDLRNALSKFESQAQKKRNILFIAMTLSLCLSIIFAIFGQFFYLGCIAAIFEAIFAGCLFFFQKCFKAQVNFIISDYNRTLIAELESAQKNVNDILDQKCCKNINEYYVFYAKSESMKDLKEKFESISRYRENIVLETQKYFEHNNIFLDIENFENDFENLTRFYEHIQKITEQINYKSQILHLDNLNIRYLKGFCKKLKLECTKVNLEEDENKLRARFEELKNMNLEEKYISAYSLIAVSHKNRKQLESHLEELVRKRKKMIDRYSALQIAVSTIEEAASDISKNLAPKLSTRSSEIFYNLTNEKYNSVYMQKNYDMMIKDKNMDRPHVCFSSGTIDQLYLSLRIAISEIILQKTALPLMFDDAFMQYDDDRLLSTLKFLKNYTLRNNSQAVIFTCHRHVKNIEPQL